MPRKQTKAQKFKDLSDTLTCLRQNLPPHRLNSRAADGSIPVKPQVKSSRPEREILEECKAWLVKHGCMVDRLNNGAHQDAGGFHFYGISGAGDLIGCLPGGRHLEVETKAGHGGRLSVAQQRRQKRVTEYGGVYCVVCSVEELEQFLQEYLNDETDGNERLRSAEDFAEGDDDQRRDYNAGS